jgi:hypothetical protein
MSGYYLSYRPMPSYDLFGQIEFRLSPGDGLKGLQSRPIWF